MVLLAPVRAAALELELGAQTLATFVSNDAVKGGGAGFGLETSVPFYRDAPRRNHLLARARAALLAGNGLAWTLEAGAAFRIESSRHFTPEVGAYLLYMAGDLARSIDRDGYLAANPWAALVGLAPLRFELDEGWVSLLSARAGTTLGAGGHPPFAISVTVFEVGRTF
jgi:hypothetical protein